MDEPPANLSERLVRLELTTSYERERLDYLIDGLSRRLLALETTTAPIPTTGRLKLALAILLPLGVLVATGDLKSAIKAMRLAIGLPA